MILVDDARWQWRGRLWAHLASDEGPDELHRFAARLGLRRTAFQGDHYDVDQAARDAALVLGAAPVPSRELLRRLHGAGLRRRAPRSALRWRELADAPQEEAGRLRPVVLAHLHPSRQAEGEAALEALLAAARHDQSVGRAGATVSVLHRPGELALVLRPGPGAWPPWHEVVIDAPLEDR